MNQIDNSVFPGGSKTRVTIAGKNIRAGFPTLDDLRVVEEWRAAHRAVLNTFQAILRNRTSTQSSLTCRKSVFGCHTEKIRFCHSDFFAYKTLDLDTVNCFYLALNIL